MVYTGAKFEVSSFNRSRDMEGLKILQDAQLSQRDRAIWRHTSKSKPEIEFQYGGYPFSETGSSFISTVDWDISSKFGMEIRFPPS